LEGSKVWKSKSVDKYKYEKEIMKYKSAKKYRRKKFQKSQSSYSIDKRLDHSEKILKVVVLSIKIHMI